MQNFIFFDIDGTIISEDGYLPESAVRAIQAARKKGNATFINTGRGAQVVEEDLCRALRECPDRTALLDVTWPEPPAPDSPLLTMENVFLTPHIAGSMKNEIGRMGQYMLQAYRDFRAGIPSRCEVTLDMLETMA